MAELPHFDSDGNARMVDVSQKPETQRMARASVVVTMKPGTLQAILDSKIAKGDVLGMARVAGVMASKKTPDLIPLCHPLRINSVDLEFEILQPNRVQVSTVVTAIDRTGVEMEALTASAAAALTIYDMCKSMDRGMTITDLRLDEKTGGKSGHFVRSDQE